MDLWLISWLFGTDGQPKVVQCQRFDALAAETGQTTLLGAPVPSFQPLCRPPFVSIDRIAIGWRSVWLEFGKYAAKTYFIFK
jgi:hypothetical protein